MSSRFDTIVIGVGAMGAAACATLAARGKRVLGIEQFDIPNDLGSSHGLTRLIRLAYHEHADYVPLLRRAYELWDKLARESGKPIITITGGIYIGERSGGLVDGSLRASGLHALNHELLDHKTVEARFPQFKVNEGQVGVFDPQAGFLRPELAISTFAANARRDGAELHTRERVIRWEASQSGVKVVTERGTYEAGTLVLCAGAWTSRLLERWSLPLTVTRQVTGFVQPARNVERFLAGAMPIWAIEHDGGLYYGAPIIPEYPGLKIAYHRAGVLVDPDQVDRAMSDADEAEIRWVLPRHLPGADGPLTGFRVCMYTNTPDGHFMIDRHPEHPNVILASPCSGHGFKFAPVIGEALADLVNDGTTSLPIEFLKACRVLEQPRSGS